MHVAVFMKQNFWENSAVCQNRFFSCYWFFKPSVFETLLLFVNAQIECVTTVVLQDDTHKSISVESYEEDPKFFIFLIFFLFCSDFFGFQFD